MKRNSIGDESINIWVILFAVGVGLALGWIIYRLFLSPQFDVFDEPVAPDATIVTPTPKPKPTPKPYDPWRDRPKVGNPRLPDTVAPPPVATPPSPRRTPRTPRPKKK